MKMAFISRHAPTQEQTDMAAAQGFELVHVGDTDAFTVDPAFVGGFEAVAVVHPAAAMRLCETHIIGVFENANRAPSGEKPQFAAVALHVYRKRRFFDD